MVKNGNFTFPPTSPRWGVLRERPFICEGNYLVDVVVCCHYDAASLCHANFVWSFVMIFGSIPCHCIMNPWTFIFPFHHYSWTYGYNGEILWVSLILTTYWCPFSGGIMTIIKIEYHLSLIYSRQKTSCFPVEKYCCWPEQPGHKWCWSYL